MLVSVCLLVFDAAHRGRGSEATIPLRPLACDQREPNLREASPIRPERVRSSVLLAGGNLLRALPESRTHSRVAFPYLLRRNQSHSLDFPGISETLKMECET